MASFRRDLIVQGWTFFVEVISPSNKWCRVAGGHGESWVTLTSFLSFLCIVAGAQSIYDFLGTLSLRCNGVPTASQPAAVEITSEIPFGAKARPKRRELEIEVYSLEVSWTSSRPHQCCLCSRIVSFCCMSVLRRNMDRMF